MSTATVKTIIQADQLRKAVDRAAFIVPRNSSLAQLETIQISMNGKIELLSTDLTIQSRIVIPQESEHGEAIINVPAQFFKDAMSKAQGELVLTFSEEDRVLHVKGATGSFHMTISDVVGLPKYLCNQSHAGELGGNEAPELQTAEPKRFTLPLEVLQLIGKKSIHFVSTDELRPSMEGVFVNNMDADGNAIDTVTMVATDGHRLLRIQKNVPGLPPMKFILPTKAIAMALRTFAADVQATYYEQDHILVLSDEFNELRTILIDEQYPQWEAVIPSNNDKRITVDRKTMIERMSAVLVFANENTKQIMLMPERSKVKIIARNFDLGSEAVETVFGDVQGFDDGFVIGFNGRFLEEALKLADGSEVTLSLSTPTRAAVIEESKPDYSLMFLVMPVRINI